MRVEQSTADPYRERTVQAPPRRVRSRAPSVAMMMVTAELLLLSSLRNDGTFLDLQVYRAGGGTWLNGMSIYDAHFPAPLPGPSLPFVYPPFAAVVFAALDKVPFSVASAIMWAASAVAVMAAATFVLRRLNLGHHRPLIVGCAAGAVALLLEPESRNLGFGQINMVLMGLVVVDLLAERTPWPRGTLIGIAAAIKLTPLAFVLLFLVRRQWRPVVAVVTSFAVCGLVGVLVAPRDSFLFWSKEMFNASQRFSLAYAANQSLRGTLHRLVLPPAVENLAWVVLVIAVGALAWVAMRRCLAVGDDVLAMLCVAAATLLVSPVSWSAHWVWIAPALVLFTCRALAAGSIRAVVALCAAVEIFAVGPFWLLPQDHGAEYHWTWSQHLFGNAYVLSGLALLVVVACRRPPATPVPEPAPAEALV